MPYIQWWQDALCYQIYPRSFADSNGDGIGDLQGILQKLDYLQSLGVDALWISPFFPSPQFDCGYDVVDYTGIHPEYGTMEDFDGLLDEAHRRGMRVILDMVLNHSSDQHQWFIDAKSSRSNPYRDWYIWRDGVDGGPPNDWESIFGGSAWTFDEATGQYYYHYFFPEQPDLNWRNPAVVDALLGAVRFWLDKGVDGFRLDAIGSIFEDEALRNSDTGFSMREIFLSWVTGTPFDEANYIEKIRYQQDLPDVHLAMQALRQLVDEYPQRILLGETDDIRYYGDGQNELHSVFNFEILSQAKLDAEEIRAVLQKRLATLPVGAWESNTIGNHDRTRSPNRHADGKDDEARQKAALAMTMFLRGTPTFYNGEEIGMHNYPMKRIEDFRDNLGVWVYQSLIEQGYPPEEALKLANHEGRDKCRTPMQWENAPNAGFSPTGVETWLPVNPDYAQGVNVAEQESSSDSMLHYFRRLSFLRREHEALRRGEMELLETGKVLAFWRILDDEKYLVALNLSAESVDLTLDAGQVETLFSAYQAGDVSLARLHLAPYEVFVGVKN